MEQEKIYLNNTLKVIEKDINNIRKVITKQGKQIDYLSQFYADQYSAIF